MGRLVHFTYILLISVLALSLTVVPHIIQKSYAASSPQLVISPHLISNMPANSRVTYSVDTVNMPTFNSYDIEVFVNGCSPKCSVLNPLSITLGTFLPPSLILNECINGTCSRGVPAATDGPGVVHVAVGSSGFAMNNGTLFQITYNITSSTGGAGLLFQNDNISDPNANPIAYTDVNGVYGVVPDIAVTAVSISRYLAYAGVAANPIKVNITVANLGTAAATFSVNATANETSTHRTSIGMPQTVNSLAPGGSVTLTFNWDTSATVRGNYFLSGRAYNVPGDITPADNVMNATGTFVVRLAGDVNGDCAVNAIDLGRIGSAFLSRAGGSGYDPEADILNHGTINSQDLGIVGSNFLKRCT